MKVGYNDSGFCHRGIEMNGYNVGKYYDYYDCSAKLKLTDGGDLNGWTLDSMFVVVGYCASWGSVRMTDRFGESWVYRADQINKGYSSYYPCKIGEHFAKIVDLIHGISFQYKGVGQYRTLQGLNPEGRLYEDLIKERILSRGTKYDYGKIKSIMDIIKEYDDLYRQVVDYTDYTDKEISQLSEKHDEFMDMFFPVSVKFKFQRTKK